MRLPRTVVPDACAAINAGAALALATLLAPGTSNAPGGHEARYVATHLIEWRAGWALWIAAAVSLIWSFAWWAARLRRSSLVRLAIVIGCAGLACDLVAESLLIFGAPDRYLEVAPFAFRLTGIGANGLYSVAGLILTASTRGLPGWLGEWSWIVWLLGIGLAIAVGLGSDPASHLLTAALFALLIPWLVVFGRRIA